MTAIGPAGRRWRTDVQALRGFAVLIVILFHSKLGVAPSGYLGVDMFFVISGFLISGIVMRQRAERRFSFVDFYLRRIRRLMPACAIVLAVVTITAIALLTASGYERFWPQLAGALTFSTNIVLWRQINYFNNSAAFEPLLHFWSLAIEEQYYLLLPLTLAVIPRRWWMPAIIVTTAVSLVAYLWLYPHSPGATFYLLPTRAWEIGLGSIGAALAGRPGGMALPASLRGAAILVLIVTPFVAPSPHFAYLLAVPACLAVFFLVTAEGNGTGERALGPLARIGDMSYSLYLVHWPLFAFANCLYLGAPLPRVVAITLIAAAILLAIPLYHFVEEPIRRAPITARRLCITALAVAVVIAATGYAGLQVKRAWRPAIDLAGVAGLAEPGCDSNATHFGGHCETGPAPQILIWGDSFSQHIVPAIAASTGRPFAEASKGGCAPLIGIAPVDLQGSEAWAKGCLAFNNSVLAWLARTPSVRVVVLSGRYLRYTEPGTRAITRDHTGTVAIGSPHFATLIEAQGRTSAAVRALGKRVIIVGAPPQADFDVGQCWERKLEELPSMTSAPQCAIAAANAHPRWNWSVALQRVFVRGGTPVIRLDRVLCSNGICKTAWRGKPLYRDTSHLSATGSILIGKRIGLGERIWREAR